MHDTKCAISHLVLKGIAGCTNQATRLLTLAFLSVFFMEGE